MTKKPPENTESSTESQPVSPFALSFQDRIRDLTQKTFLLVIIAIVIKIFGLIRTAVTANIFGAEINLDMFLAIFGSTVLLFEVIPTAFNQALVPRYVEFLIKGDRQGFNKAVSTSINYVLIIGLVVFLLASFYAAPIRKLFFQFPPDTLPNITTYANWLFRLAFVVLFLNIFIGSFTAILYSHDQVISPSILNFINGINVLFAILFTHQYLGIFSMVLGYITGGISQIIYLSYFVRKTGYRWSPLIFEGLQGFHEFVRPIGPAYLALVIGQLNIVIDRAFTSRLIDPGMISLLNYAGQMILIIVIFSTAFSNAILPKLSSSKSLSRPDEYRILLIRGIMVLLLMILPIAISSFLTARPLTNLILFHGKFANNPVNVLITVHIFRIMIIWSIFFTINTQLMNVFYTYRDFRIPIICTSISVVVNILFNILFTGITFGLPITPIARLGVIGIATSTALGICVSIIVSIFLLRGRIGWVVDWDVIKQLVKLAIPSVFALGVGYLVNWKLFFSRYHGISPGITFSLLQLVVVSLVTFLVFWLISLLVNRDRVLFIFSMLYQFTFGKLKRSKA